MKFLDSLPYLPLVIIAIIMGLAPFTPPHLVEKFRMLMNGDLRKPIDIFDLFFHLAPAVLLLAKLWRDFMKNN